MNQNDAENYLEHCEPSSLAEVQIAEVLPVEPTEMQPVQSGERIPLIDVLRGFALFGILCVNMQFYTTPMAAMGTQPPFWPNWYDRLATGAIELLAAGKFYILFSFLFGLGISVQMLRADARGGGFAWYHVRRMFVLLAFGCLHAYFLWMGDILQTYAVVGLMFLLFVRLRPKWLLICAAIFYILPLLFIGCMATLFEIMQFIPPLAKMMDREVAQAMEGRAEEIAETIRIYSQGTFLEIMRLRAGEVIQAYFMVVFWMGPTVVAMFLVGMTAGKLQLFRNVAQHLPRLGKLRWWALGVGLLGNAVYVLASKGADMNMPGFLMVLAVLGLTVGAPPLTFFYVSSIARFHQTERGSRLLAPLGQVGRMALTNYLLQSVICTTVFYSYGLGYYAQLGPLAGLGLTVLIFLFQIPFSILWLKFYRYGPMEWLWRSVTYLKPQPMRL